MSGDERLAAPVNSNTRLPPASTARTVTVNGASTDCGDAIVFQTKRTGGPASTSNALLAPVCPPVSATVSTTPEPLAVNARFTASTPFTNPVALAGVTGTFDGFVVNETVWL